MAATNAASIVVWPETRAATSAGWAFAWRATPSLAASVCRVCKRLLTRGTRAEALKSGSYM